MVYLIPVLLAFALVRENRTPPALLIVLPVLLVWGLSQGLFAVLRFPAESLSMINAFFYALLVGFTVVWLLAERIGNRHRFATFLLAALVMLGAMALMLADIGISRTARSLVSFGAMTLLIIPCSFAFAGFLCRRRFGPVRFSLWLALGLLLTTVAGIGVYYTFHMLSYFSFFYLWIILIWSVFYALFYGLILLPFLVLFFVNNFWRNRFAAVMGMGATSAVVPQTVLQEQEPMD